MARPPSARRLVYLDHCATTPVAREVMDAMRAYFTDRFGNPASRGHQWGRDAEMAIAKARMAVADLVASSPDKVVWTSGATEANNIAILGMVASTDMRKPHVVTQVTEHHSVLDVCRELERQGAEVTYLPVDRTGRINIDDLRQSVTKNTVLVSIMAANNEIGTIQPIREIGSVCRERGVVFHCDASQAVAKIPVNMDDNCIDLLTISSHKLYGPKGVGAICESVRASSFRLRPIMFGGGHERGLRPGTINVPGAVGMGAACALAMRDMAADAKRLQRLRDTFEERILNGIEGARVNGCKQHRLPHVSNISFANIDSGLLLSALPEIGASIGSACSSADVEPSYVIRAIGVAKRHLQGSVRFSLGRENTAADLDYAADRVISMVTGLMSMHGGKKQR